MPLMGNGKVAMLKSCLRNDSGATIVEYAILSSLIAAVCIGVVTTIGVSAHGLYAKLGGKF